MKTLDTVVQIAIISEAGSTYRNYLLTTAKESMCGAKQLAENATHVAQTFIDVIVKNLKGQIVITPVKADGGFWYEKFIGQSFEVIKEHEKFYEVSQPGVDRVGGSCILKEDC